MPMTTVNTAIDDPVLRTFEIELGELWPQLAPLCSDPGTDVAMLPARSSQPGSGVTELDALLAGWVHFGPAERTVLNAALNFLNKPDSRIDGTPDIVVDATVRALLRGPRR